MDEDTMMQVRRALNAPQEPTPEIVFCDECPDLALGRLDDAPLCLACMLAQLGRAQAGPGDLC